MLVFTGQSLWQLADLVLGPLCSMHSSMQSALTLSGHGGLTQGQLPPLWQAFWSQLCAPSWRAREGSGCLQEVITHP